MDIIAVMRVVLLLPIATFVVVVGLFFHLKRRHALRASFAECMVSCVKWGVVTLGASLVMFIVWMFWLSSTGNGEAVQAPLVWFFGIGPVCFMAGFIIGFMVWYRSRVPQR